MIPQADLVLILWVCIAVKALKWMLGNPFWGVRTRQHWKHHGEQGWEFLRLDGISSG